MITKSNFRLIWFPHFQKSAGTTVVSLAGKNGETLFPHHKNGHPIDVDGKYLPIQDMSGSELTRFIDYCESISCTFLAPSWGTGDLATLQNDERVLLASCIRDPWERFKSNFVFDFRLGYTREREIEMYVGSKRSYSFFNYYTHSLSRLPQSQIEITQQDLQCAKEALRRFDVLEIVGEENWLLNFCKKLGWNFYQTKANRRKNALLEIFRNLIRGRPEVARRIFLSSHLNITAEFEEWFRSCNVMDYEIFSMARELARPVGPCE